MNEHIILAYILDGKGGGVSCKEQTGAMHCNEGRLTWTHLDSAHPESKVWLKNTLKDVENYVIDGLLSDVTRPRMNRIGSGAIVNLRGVNLNADADPEDMVSICCWIDEQRIISVRRDKLRAVRDVEQLLLDGIGPSNSGDFISLLSKRLSERMEPILLELDDRTDVIEEQVAEKPDSALRDEIVNIRIQAIMFKRYMSPQRDAIEQLRQSDFFWITDKNKRHLQENYNQVVRFVEDIDAIRERAQIVKDELANTLAEQLNKNLYILSVIAAIFLPLSFLTGLFGINIGGMPGVDHSQAFWVFCSAMALILIVQIYLFKKFKWF